MSMFYDVFYCILISAFCWLKYKMQKKKSQIKQIILKMCGWWIPAWIYITIWIKMYNWESIFSLFTQLQDMRFSYTSCKIKLVSTQFAPEVLWDGQHRLHQCLPHYTVNQFYIFKKIISYIFLTLQWEHVDLNICSPSLSCNIATVTDVMYE